MSVYALRRLWLMVALFVLVPGVATAQRMGPSVLFETSMPVRIAGSFVLVLLFGGTLVYLYDEFVERSVETSLEQPLTSVVYGIAAQGGVLFLGGYALSQLAQVGGTEPIVDIVFVAIGVVTLTLAGLGFTVVGTHITDVASQGNVWHGLAVGAGLSAIAWATPSFVAGVAIWVGLVAVGIGGPTKNWMHASKSVESEVET